jgi:hypothetical protein
MCCVREHNLVKACTASPIASRAEDITSTAICASVRAQCAVSPTASQPCFVGRGGGRHTSDHQGSGGHGGLQLRLGLLTDGEERNVVRQRALSLALCDDITLARLVSHLFRAAQEWQALRWTTERYITPLFVLVIIPCINIKKPIRQVACTDA